MYLGIHTRQNDEDGGEGGFLGTNLTLVIISGSFVILVKVVCIILSTLSLIPMFSFAEHLKYIRF